MHAILYYSKCLYIQQNIKGVGSIDTAETINKVGEIALENNDYEFANKCFK